MLLLVPTLNFGQAPPLGSTSNFAVFTAVGAFSNDGLTVVTGDIGTNVGAFAGFPPGIVAGTISIADPVTAQAAADVELAYGSFGPISCDLVLGTTMGNNQVLGPAVYCLGGASSLNGDLVLDGQCDPDALFIFKINGALSTTSFSNIILINNANACNIYWQINGAVSLGESSNFKGTIVANGAISLLEGASLQGRALSRAGAVDMHNNMVTIDMQPIASNITTNTASEFCEGGSVIISGNCGGVWNTGETTPTITVSTSGDYYVTNSNACGSAVSIHVTVIVNPMPPCSITGNDPICNGSATQFCATAGMSSYSWNTGATTPCIEVGVAGTYSVTITDANGCSSICSRTITGNSAPICTITGEATICEGQSTDLCTPAGAASYMWSTGATTSCISVNMAGNYSVTVTGANGCTSICSQTVTSSPIPTCSITGGDIPCNSQSSDLCVPAGAAGYMWSTGATTNCVTVFAAGTYSVTITNAGNCTSICSITIANNQDNTPPAISCPADLTLACDLSPLPPSTGTATATDACDLAPSIDFTDDTMAGNCPQSYTITRVWAATDDAGNSSTCSQTINIADNIPPTIVCPASLSIQCNASTLPASTGTATANDNCSATPVTTFSDATAPGNCPQAFTITRTWTATDACGNTSNCNQTINIIDNVAPVVSCPANATVQCASLVPAVNIGLVVATDNCGGATTVSHLSDVVSNQSCANRYTLTRTYQAVDACGNAATCAQLITVFDATIPTIPCPANATVQCASLVPSVNIGLVIATDNCGGAATTVSHLGDVVSNQTCENRYTITRTYQAADACGQTATCTQIISVFDSTLPMVTCPANATAQCASLIPAVNIGLVVATDNCGGAATTVSHLGDVVSNQTCANRYTITRTYQAADACGLTATCTQLITVFDSTIPTITCPANATVQCTSLVPVVNIGLAIATDNCGGAATTVSHLGDALSNQTCANQYLLTRTYRATDACGLTATCIQLITVFDATIPTIACPANATVQCSSLVPAVNIGLVVATDNCGGTATTVSHLGDVISNQTCANRYTLTRTYQAADACGQTATCTQIISVFDSTLPMVTCPANATVQCASLVPAVNIGLVVATDNCGSAVAVTHTGDAISNQTCTNQYLLTRTYRATDACGNVANCAQVITVFDNTPPTIGFINPLLVPGSTVNVQCFGQDPNWNLPVFNAGSITATDICGGTVDIIFNNTLEQEGNCSLDGFINLYRLTWTATDICGNSSNIFIFLALIDTIAPTISGVPADITVNCNDIPAAPTNIVAVDECLCACDVAFEESATVQGCQNGQVILRSWTAKDRCGNMTTQTQTITLVDDQGPDWLVLLPEIEGITHDTMLHYACGDGFPAYLDLLNGEFVLGQNSCGASFVLSFEVDTIISANCKLSGFLQQRNYHWTGVDACGNISSLTISAQLGDSEAPVLIGVPAGATCVGSPLLNLVLATDGCGATVVQFNDAPVQNPCGAGQAIQRTYMAQDACGNTARDTVMLMPNDNNQPIMWFVNPVLAEMEAGETLTTECASQNGTYTNYGVDDVNVEDACMEGTTVSFTETLISTGDCTTDGMVATVQLKWTATDICGNHSELVITANIVDETSPVFVNFLPEITIGCNADLPVPLITDNCGGITSSTWDTIIYSNCVFKYDVQRIITATDQCGNTATGIQTVHVGDGSGPVMSEIEEFVCDDMPVPMVTAYDTCAGAFVPVTIQVDTLPCDVLAIQRTWTAVSFCGDTTVRHQIIIINDTVPPIIAIPANSIIQQFVNGINGTISSSQEDLINQLNSLDSSSISIAPECQQPIIPVFTLEVSYADNCLEDGYSERRKYTWVATDLCGNSTTLTFSVDIMDNTPPVLSAYPKDATIVCAPLPMVPVIFADDGTQSTTVAYTETIEPGIGVGVYIVTRTWTATDACGNVTVYVQHIKWMPDTFLQCNILLPDVVDCNTHGVSVSSAYTGGNGTVTYNWEIVGENCFVQTGQGTPNITMYMGWTGAEIILTATDEFGCVSTCTADLDCLFSLAASSDLSPIMDTGTDTKTIPSSTTQRSNGRSLGQLNLYPNPANGNLNLSFESAGDNEFVFSFTNFLGQIVLSDISTAQKGLNNFKIDMSKVPEGSYLFQIKTAKEVHTKTVVIMHNN